MSAKDIYHDQVKTALERDGWIVTHDPLPLKWGGRDAYVDLGAERLLAQKVSRKIAVEVKSFVGASEMRDMYTAIGQVILYRSALADVEPDRQTYLAIRETTYLRLFDQPDGQRLLESEEIRLIVFDPEREEIVLWVP
ncbi:MAG: XisH family protein [Blastocatellia bacterium]|nr:XisH family protein [Blastocatellia bacterium]